MERNSRHSQGYKLESQIREAFCRITYTQTCHDKRANYLVSISNRIKIAQIILSAITTGGFVTAIIYNEQFVTIIGACISLLLLIVNSYTKNFNLVEDAQEHQNASNLLWKIREEYVSLLTDFEILDIKDIMKKRDELQDRTYEIYNHTPKTDKKSYLETQKSLKVEEEQTFSEKEIDVMLPNSIRRNTRTTSDSK